MLLEMALWPGLAPTACGRLPMHTEWAAVDRRATARYAVLLNARFGSAQSLETSCPYMHVPCCGVRALAACVPWGLAAPACDTSWYLAAMLELAWLPTALSKGC